MRLLAVASRGGPPSLDNSHEFHCEIIMISAVEVAAAAAAVQRLHSRRRRRRANREVRQRSTTTTTTATMSEVIRTTAAMQIDGREGSEGQFEDEFMTSQAEVWYDL